MCGIVGILHACDDPIDAHRLEVATETLTPRGPDAFGYWVRGHVGLGHRRLSIIDLDTGDQPIGNEDGSAWVVFNGEIFNFAELRRDLIAKGHTFATDSDTEVIVHQYEEDGDACVERFRGMFAFALWDIRKGRLLLARDRFGIKPLFVAESAGRLAFASEMKALLTLPWVDRSWSPCGLRAYLALGYIPGELTAYNGIRRFSPGTVEVWRADGAAWQRSVRSYWRPTATTDGHALTYAAAKDRLRELLLESVRMRLRSDVPLGAFLSGGVDSTTVVALMRQCGAESLSTFSMGFEDAEYDELPYARLAARHLGTEYHQQIVTAADATALPMMLAAFDEPFGDSSAIPTYLVSRFARQHVTVSLSGDGGDELFAGYYQHGRPARLANADKVPFPLRSAIGRVGSRFVPEYRRGGGFLRDLSVPAEQRRLRPIKQGLADVLSSDVLSRPFLEFLGDDGHDWKWQDVYVRPSSATSAQLIDQSVYLPDDILVKVDRCSMAVSLEARVPLLDHVLADFVNSLPETFKLRDGRTKAILKDVIASYVPRAILERGKRGFSVPLRAWLRGPLRAFADDVLSGGSASVLDAAVARRLLHGLDEKSGDASSVWWLLSLAMWAQSQPSRPW